MNNILAAINSQHNDKEFNFNNNNNKKIDFIFPRKLLLLEKVNNQQAQSPFYKLKLDWIWFC